MSKRTGRGAAYRNRAVRVETIKEVELPSGETFLLREPNLEAFVLSGTLPFSLALKLEKIQQQSGGDVGNAFAQLSPEEMEKSVDFGARLLRHICVDPKIVDFPSADDEISIEDLDADDLKFLQQWGQSGGGNADLDSFRRRSKSTPVAGADGKKHGKATKRAA